METKSIERLFNNIRAITVGKKLSQVQVDSINAILASCAKHTVTDIHQIGYILATAYHESRLKPVEEVGKGKGYDYGKKLDMGAGVGKRIPYTMPDVLYYGRGFVQITWLSNYRYFGKVLGVDLVNHPELAMQIPVAAEIIVMGMKNGSFTGKKLSNYFTGVTNDSVNARRIVNGTDCAGLISAYYNHIIEGVI